MFTVIFEDGFQFNATLDGAANLLCNHSTRITNKHTRGPLTIIDCETPWDGSGDKEASYRGPVHFSITCTSSVAMSDLLQSWAKQF